jgi:hypothetical protein
VTPETIAALLASPVLGAVAAKGWQWWTTRDAAKLAAEAAEAKVRHEREAASRVASAGERADIVALLQQQLAAGEGRAETASARAVAMAGSLTEVAAAMRENSAALDALRAALTASLDATRGALSEHAAEEYAAMREMHTMLRQLVGDGSDVSRASIVPGVRGPTPPRGIVPLPAAPAPARRGGE